MLIASLLLTQAIIEDGMITIHEPTYPSYTSTRQLQICNDIPTEVFFDTKPTNPLIEIKIQGKLVEKHYIDRVNSVLKNADIVSVSLIKCDIVNGIYATTFQFKIFEGGESPRKLIHVDFFSRTIQAIREE